MYRHIKRALDVVFSALAIVALSPLLLIISISVKITSPGPVLFLQRRVGRNGEHFMIYKFRTMRTNAPKYTPTNRLGNPNRFLTPIGGVLRSSSLDELPQLLNILRGEMSLVGPRPVLSIEYELIAARKALGVETLRPGLTGWAQINGRDEISDEQKARYDAEYLAKISFLLDAKCILGTFACLLRGNGI